MVHKHHTALEILEQVAGPIHGFCSGVGTGGTISGIGESLKALNPDITVWAVEPEHAAILAGGNIGTHLQMGIAAYHRARTSPPHGAWRAYSAKEKPSSRFCRTPQKDIFRPRSLTNKALFANKTPPAKAGAA